MNDPWIIVSNGQGGHNYFGARARPKSVGFGEVARGEVAWKSAGSALRWIAGIGHEG